MKKMMLLFNETSGKDKGKELATSFITYAKQRGYKDSLFFMEQVGPNCDSQRLVSKAKKEKIDNLIFIGGDGTINHNVEDFKEIVPKINIGLLPAGTVNNMARVLGIPVKMEKAADIILDGQTRKIDYGLINNKVIVSTMTIGILADTASRISQADKQKYGKRIFIKNFFKLLAQKKRYHLTIKTEKQEWSGKTQLVMVTMTNSAGGYTHFDASASPDDGLFHLTVLPKLNFFKAVFYIPKIISGKFYEIPGLEYMTAEKIEIKSNKSKKVGTRVDGDPSENLPIEMRVVKHGLTVFVPASK